MKGRGDRTHAGHPRAAGVDSEVIDEEDVIGTASARLLSTCADRTERLAALSLLGLLLDHADQAGHIRLPLQALERELDLEPDRAVRLLQHLVAVEAVRTEGDAVVVTGVRPGGGQALGPSRFLANLMTVLAREPSESAPGGVEAPGSAGAVAVRAEPRSKRRVLVALGVGLAAMAMTAAPSGDPGTSLRTVVAPPAPTGRAPWATAPVQAEAPPATVPTTGEGPAGSHDRHAPGDDAATSRGPAVPGGVSEPHDPLMDAGGEPSQQRSPSGRSTDAPLSVPSPPAPTTAPAAPPDGQGRTCPSGTPASEVTVLSTGPVGVLGQVGNLGLQVTGTVTNTSEAAVTITAVDVTSGEGPARVVESAGPVPFTLGPGEVGNWEASLLVGLSPSLAPLVDVQVTGWSWTDPDLAASCPT